jgi:hypothetical protein
MVGPVLVFLTQPEAVAVHGPHALRQHVAG